MVPISSVCSDGYWEGQGRKEKSSAGTVLRKIVCFSNFNSIRIA